MLIFFEVVPALEAPDGARRNRRHTMPGRRSRNGVRCRVISGKENCPACWCAATPDSTSGACYGASGCLTKPATSQCLPAE